MLRQRFTPVSLVYTLNGNSSSANRMEKVPSFTTRDLLISYFGWRRYARCSAVGDFILSRDIVEAERAIDPGFCSDKEGGDSICLKYQE